MPIADHTVTELRDLAADLAREAAGVLEDTIGSGALRVETKGAISDLVTSADRASEEHIVDRLRRERPDDGIVGEEGHEVASRSGVTWIIDPLDGTTNFVQRMPPFGVSIGAWRDLGGDDEPVAAAVYDLAHRELFSAGIGQGATLDGMPIVRTAPTGLGSAIVGTGFAHDHDIRAAEAELLTRVLPAVGDLRRSGAGAFDLCWVAMGRLDAFYQAGLKLWDYAAARLVLTESGSDLTLLPGLAGSGPIVLGSATSLTAELAELLGASTHHNAGGTQWHSPSE